MSATLRFSCPAQLHTGRKVEKPHSLRALHQTSIWEKMNCVESISVFFSCSSDVCEVCFCNSVSRKGLIIYYLLMV